MTDLTIRPSRSSIRLKHSLRLSKGISLSFLSSIYINSKYFAWFVVSNIIYSFTSQGNSFLVYFYLPRLILTLEQKSQEGGPGMLKGGEVDYATDNHTSLVYLATIVYLEQGGGFEKKVNTPKTSA